MRNPGVTTRVQDAHDSPALPLYPPALASQRKLCARERIDHEHAHPTHPARKPVNRSADLGHAYPSPVHRLPLGRGSAVQIKGGSGPEILGGATSTQHQVSEGVAKCPVLCSECGFLARE